MHKHKEYITEIGDLAVKALVYELATTPKPGLVDKENSGAHTDMDYPMFRASALSLRNCFEQCALAGIEHEKEPLEWRLRKIGLAGEKAMFEIVVQNVGPTSFFHIVASGGIEIIMDNISVFQYDLYVDIPVLNKHTNYTGETFDISWSAVEGADSYLVNVYSVNEMTGAVSYLYKDEPVMGTEWTVTEAVSGQTYSRKVDTRVLNVLAGIASSAHKFSNDIRLLQHLKEIEEPFEKNQIGSSAMAYKRNPMRSERIASLANFVMADAMNPAMTASTQWFERTLDDSANKRLSVPEAFLAVDGILDLYLNVVDGLVVYPKVIYKQFMSEIPFMATENIMMDAVKHGGNRQELHEKIRQLSMEAGKNVKVEGKENNLVDLIAADPSFGLTKEQIESTLKPELYVGRAPYQVEVYLRDVVNPVLEANKDELGATAEINV